MKRSKFMKIKRNFIYLALLGLSLFLTQAMLRDTTSNNSSEGTIQTNNQEAAINPSLVDAFKIRYATLEQYDSKNLYLSWLQEEEAAIWKGFEALVGITKQECENRKKEYYPKYKALVRKLDEEYRDTQNTITPEDAKLAQEILREFSIDPDTIALVPWKNLDAGSTDISLYLQESPYMPVKAKKFVITHEIAHMLNKDHSTSRILKKAYSKRKDLVDSPELAQLLKRFAYFKELRADIIAILHSNDCLEGQIQYMEHNIECAAQDINAHEHDHTHPSDTLRLAIGKNIQKSAMA